MPGQVDKSKRQAYWYFGGLGSAGAACCTHPLDLLKVHLQTQQEGKTGLLRMGVKVFRSDGIAGLYNGLSASLLRQMTYSLTRFGMYETLKKQFPQDKGPPSFLEKVLMASVSGGCGGLVGTPGDMVNVRMQNDMKLPPEQRRNYKNALDGLYRVTREEGVLRMFNGATMATVRAVFMTVGQLAFYDQFKQVLLGTPFFQDNLVTHFSASLMASGVATVITQPLDVMKTRMMNARPGEFNGILDCFMFTARMGPMGFFKGFLPAFVRLAPQTILTFVFFEQLRMNFGYLTPEQLKKSLTKSDKDS